MKSTALSPLLGALSYALDLASGHTDGHALRACVIGMKIGKRVHLKNEDLGNLFYALLLKDIGMASRASGFAQFRKKFGLESYLLWRYGRALIPRRRWLLTLREWMKSDRSDAGVYERFNEAMSCRIVHQEQRERSITLARSRVSALGLSKEIGDVVAFYDESYSSDHDARCSRDISIQCQIVHLAQILEMLHELYGGERAIEIVHSRCKDWFDPALVVAVTLCFHSEEKWRELEQSDLIDFAAHFEPLPYRKVVDEADIDVIFQVFGKLADSCSSYTEGHSENVSQLCIQIASYLGISKSSTTNLYRAALLHDLGCLGVERSLIDKPGPLTIDEDEEIRRCPERTLKILNRVKGFGEVARIASSHHERLDGSGYPLGLEGQSICILSRVIAVAEVTEALAAERAYRPKLTAEEILDCLDRYTPGELDITCVNALHSSELMNSYVA